MAWNLPNLADAFSPFQAEIDANDLKILAAGSRGIGFLADMAVTAQGSPNMTVAVTSGTVQVVGASVVQAAVSSGNVTITTANGANPRLDLIAVNSSGTKSVVTGTPAAAPVFAAIPASSAIAAAIIVPAGVTSILSTYIYNRDITVPNLISPGSLVTEILFKRIKATLGTALVAGDFALSGGWGSTASVGSVTGNDQAAQFVVTSAGTGQAASPTITITFKDGTWTAAPKMQVMRNGGDQPAIFPTWTTSATQLVITWPSTPISSETYTFNFGGFG